MRGIVDPVLDSEGFVGHLDKEPKWIAELSTSQATTTGAHGNGWTQDRGQ